MRLSIARSGFKSLCGYHIFPCRLTGKSLGFDPKEFLFEPRHGNHYGYVAQLVEHQVEALSVIGSKPILHTNMVNVV